MFLYIFFAFLFVLATPFIGEDDWDQDYRKLCDAEQFQVDGKLFCVEKTLIPTFETLKIEVINWSPALVKYHGLMTKNEVEKVMRVIDTAHKQAVHVDLKVRQVDKSRQANGTWIDNIHQLVPSISSKLDDVINFSSAESVQGLSYLPGGHYAPHYDYFEEDSPHYKTDLWIRMYRNRLATLILVFQTAPSGGGTVFPELGVTVKAEPGDAYFWFSMKADESLEKLSLHGGCPVYSGEKTIGTMWIRAKNQPILEKLLDEKQSIPASILF